MNASFGLSTRNLAESSDDHARAIQRCPVDEGPDTRTTELREAPLRLADRCEGRMVRSHLPADATEVVSLAIVDAEALLQTAGCASSACRC